MNRSAATAPDVMYEDTLPGAAPTPTRATSPASTSTLAKWTDWAQFDDNAKQAGLGRRRQDLRRPMGTDTRALWYNKDALRPGRPAVPSGSRRRGTTCSSAARTIKAKLPDVIPFNIYAGKATGEARLDAGLRDAALRHRTARSTTPARKKWVTGSQGLQGLTQLHQDGLRREARPDAASTPSTPTSAAASRPSCSPGQARHRARRLLAERSRGSSGDNAVA